MNEKREIVVDADSYAEGVEEVEDLDLDLTHGADGDDALLEVVTERGEKGIDT